jgi:hypothetical protein
VQQQGSIFTAQNIQMLSLPATNAQQEPCPVMVMVMITDY